MLIFSIALFFSFIYFIARLSAVLSTKAATNKARNDNGNNEYQQASGVTIECEEYRVKKSS